MASRRIISTPTEKTPLDIDSSPRTNDSQKSDIAPAVPTHVIVKLLAFTLAMVVGPLGTYYLTLNTVFGGNSTFAGATAAIMANVVLIGYVVVAMREDQSDALEAATEGKKGR